MKPHRLAHWAPLVLTLLLAPLLAGCPKKISKYSANLSQGLESSLTCPVSGVNAYINIPGDEDFQVTQGLHILVNLRHQSLTKGAVEANEWVDAGDEPDRTTVYAALVAPNTKAPRKLTVGDLHKLEGQRICVGFYDPAFTGDGAIDLSDQQALRNAYCCGVLRPEKQ